MIFNEFASQNNKKEKTIAYSYHSIRKQVEIEVQSNNPKNEVQVFNEECGSVHDQQQLYNIATGKRRRQIRPP